MIAKTEEELYSKIEGTNDSDQVTHHKKGNLFVEVNDE